MLITEEILSSSLGSRLTDSLNYFLIEISGKIQVTRTQREKAEGHYVAMADLLKNSPAESLLNKLDVKMMPFGGLGTNTATKPFLNDEFDLDLIVRFLAMTSRFGSAYKLYNEVHDRIYSLDGYKDRIEKKDRCIRVHYAGDFYLDLMPSAVEQLNQGDKGKLWVPERQKDGSFQFVLVDPIGLMDWFETKCALQGTIDNRLTEKRDFEVMPLTSEEARKPPLKQATQLIKRARDVYFSKDDDCKKILKSVVILTVAGNSYAGERDLYHLVGKILTQIDLQTANLTTTTIRNPVNAAEDFLHSIRKKPERHTKLRKFISHVKNQWLALGQANKGLDFQKSTLKNLFGETVTNAVINEYGERLDHAYRSESVRMAPTGLLGVSAAGLGTKVPRHQFFGDK